MGVHLQIKIFCHISNCFFFCKLKYFSCLYNVSKYMNMCVCVVVCVCVFICFVGYLVVWLSKSVSDHFTYRYLLPWKPLSPYLFIFFIFNRISLECKPYRRDNQKVRGGYCTPNNTITVEYLWSF